MGQRQAILDGLLETYKGAKVLYAKDVAVELGKPSAAAARALMNSKGCPLPVRLVGGRPTVTTFDMASWLAGEPIPSIDVSYAPASKPPTPVAPQAASPLPKRPPRESLGKYLTLLRGQMLFLEELAVEMEAMVFAESVEVKVDPDAPVRTLENREDIL